MRHPASRFCYRILLLRLVPSHLRRSHGREMERLFAETIEMERQRLGPLAFVSVWFGATRDVLAVRMSRRRAQHLAVSTVHRLRLQTRGGPAMAVQHLVYDSRHGVRGLRRSPLFAAAGLATLGVGIGGTVALFSVVRAVLLDPPAYAAPQQVVNLYETRERQPGRRSNMAYPDVVDVRERSQTLAGVAARQSWDPTLLGAGAPVELEGGSVSAAFFSLLGVEPVVGRLFDEGDGVPGHTPVVVIGHELWTERFGADPAIVGRTLDLSGTSYEVVGVAPADFEDTDGPNVVWRADPPHFDVNQQSRTGHSFRPAARIANGYTLEEVNAELAQINTDLIRAHPEKTGDGMVAVPVMDVLVGQSRAAIVVLFAAVSLLLLIACANVANLMLARATTRSREMAIRTALGAGPGRLAAQLLVESLVLAVAGGAAGVALAWAAVPAFINASTAIPRADRIAMDPLVLGFAVAVTLIVGIGFGLAPAFAVGRQPPVANLRDGQGTAEAARGRTLRNVLVVAELALSMVLLIGSGLLIRSFLNLQQVDKGVRTEDVLTMRVSPSSANWPGHRPKTRYWEQVIAAVTAIPGVRTAGSVSFLPMSGGYEGQGIRRADRPEPPPGQGFSAEARAVTPDYFRTIGITVIRGRGFTAADDSAGPPVVAVNQTLARQLYPGEDPLGKALIVQREPHEIVGIVSDARQFGVEAPVRPEVYAPHAQPFVSWIRGTMDLVVHADGDPLSLAGTVREAVWSVDRTAPISQVKTMERWASEDVAGPRFRTLILGALAGVALLLAVVGITGVLSYAVGRRTAEFGLRAALGATSADVVRLVLVDGGRLIGIGMAVGLGIALMGTRFLRSVLFEVGASDPVTVAAVTVGVLLVASAAMLIPAVRAGRVSPMVAMRAE